MEFRRVKKRGRTQDTYKEWRSECGQYRIVWMAAIQGVKITPRYHATVRVVLPDGYEMWDFADRCGPYRKAKTAMEACEKNRKLWQAFVDLSRESRRATRLRALNDRAGRILRTLPIWVRGQADETLIAMQFPKGKPCLAMDEEDLEPSDNTSEPSQESGSSTGGLAPAATVTEPSSTRQSQPSKTNTASPGSASTAPPAKAPATARRPRGSKGTTSTRKSVGNSQRSKPRSSRRSAA